MADLIHFERLDDDLVERLGYPIRSSYVEHFYLPILGPTTLWLARRTDAMLESSVSGKVSVDRVDLASMLGLGEKGGKNSSLSRSLARLVAFSVAQEHAGVYFVRRALQPLRARQIDRLPGPLQAAHAVALRANRPATLKTAAGQ